MRVKFYILSGILGFTYDFEIYTRQENDPNNRHKEESNLGAASNIVVRMTRNVTRNVNHKVHFDNYFTNVNLRIYLSHQEIQALGTFHKNCIPSNKIMDNDIEIMPRESSKELVASVESVDLSIVLWKDKNLVTLLSNFSGNNPQSTTERFDYGSKKVNSLPCPNVGQKYNKHMGGVS